jgi:hypothetical protein
MSAAAMANWAAGSSGVGPGVNKRVFRIIFSLLAQWAGVARGSANHRIHTFVVYVDFYPVQIPEEIQIWESGQLLPSSSE